ncbi:MAG: hypothetical protein IKT56_02815 [Clostridia bacterium]|nr:hypothetical protein [Clostridia bacterium]
MNIADKEQVVSANNVIIAENEQKVYDAGKQAEYDRFWDAFQNYGKRTDYSYAFAYGGWNNNTYNPKYIISPSACNGLFMSNTTITDTKVTIDLISSNGSQKNGLFSGAIKLKTIRKLIVDETIGFQSSPPMFNKCTSLEDIKFEGVIGKDLNISACPLVRESIDNIFDHLKDFTVWTETTDIAWTEKTGYPTKIKVVLNEGITNPENCSIIYIEGDNTGSINTTNFFNKNGEFITTNFAMYENSGFFQIVDVIDSNKNTLTIGTDYNIYTGSLPSTSKTVTFNATAVDNAYTDSEWKGKVSVANKNGWTVETV